VSGRLFQPIVIKFHSPDCIGKRPIPTRHLRMRFVK
jgi:hypothetical protein